MIPRYSNYAYRHTGALLVIGGSSHALHELEAAELLRPGSMRMSVGHAAGMVKVDFVVSDHYDVHAELGRLQDLFGGIYTTHCTRNRKWSDYPAVDYWWRWPRADASSVQTAIRIGLAVGFDEVILCGCPLEHGRIQHPAQRLKDGNQWPPPRDVKRWGFKRRENTSGQILAGFRENFAKHSPQWQGKVFSMSGFTQGILGPPPREPICC